jgi:hypothetical protein
LSIPGFEQCHNLQLQYKHPQMKLFTQIQARRQTTDTKKEQPMPNDAARVRTKLLFSVVVRGRAAHNDSAQRDHVRRAALVLGEQVPATMSTQLVFEEN